MFTRLARRRQHGLTMIELLMFIVIVGIAVAGVLGILTYTTRHSADPQLRKQALAIAESLLEEVELARFTYCDPTDPKAETAANTTECVIPEKNGQIAPEPVGTRPYDNVNDYVPEFGKPQTTAFNNAAGVLSDASGNPIGVAGYTATLTVTATDSLGPADPLFQISSTGTPLTMNVLRVTVTVTYNGGNDAITLDGYRTRYAPNSIP